jgi:hypothetical protein
MQSIIKGCIIFFSRIPTHLVFYRLSNEITSHNMDKIQLDQLRHDLSFKAKNGIDFILAAAIIWSIIAFIWTKDYSSYNKGVLTFIVGSPLILLAYTFSRIFRTQWKIPDNPLQPLGLILNFAQLFYFPFLVFLLVKTPDYFLMGYIIITGAHLFPYFWFYDNIAYAIFSAIISMGGLILTLSLSLDQFYISGAFTSISLFALFVILFFSIKKE